MKLQRSETSNRFCVPAALALLLDVHVDEAEKLIKEELGDVVIEGVYYPIILKILQDKGIHFFEDTMTMKGRFLICMPGHVGVVIDWKYFDNQNPNGIPIQKIHRKIEKVFKVSNPNG